MPDKMRIEVAPNQEVTALVYAAGNPDLAGVTVILGHGAGADQSSDFMTRFATGEHGLADPSMFTRFVCQSHNKPLLLSRSQTHLVPLRQDGDRSPYNEESDAMSQFASPQLAARSFLPAVQSNGDAPWRASRQLRGMSLR